MGLRCSVDTASCRPAPSRLGPWPHALRAPSPGSTNAAGALQLVVGSLRLAAARPGAIPRNQGGANGLGSTPPRTSNARTALMPVPATPTRMPLVLVANAQEWVSRSLESILRPAGYA